MKNETQAIISFDQFETFVTSISENMDSWWSNMLIGRIWNSAQTSVGASQEKLSKINTDSEAVNAKIDEEMAKIPESAPDKAKLAIKNRIHERYAKVTTRFDKDKSYNSDRIEQGKNIMAWVIGINSDLANHFLKSDDCSAEQTIEFLTSRDVSSDDDIRVGYVKISNPTMSFDNAIIEFYSMPEEKQAEIDKIVAVAKKNRDDKVKAIAIGIEQARQYAKNHANLAKPYDISREFMHTKFEGMLNTVVKSEAKILTELEVAKIKLLSLNIGESQIPQHRNKFLTFGTYDFTELRDIFQAELNYTGVMLVIEAANDIQRQINELEQSNLNVEIIDQVNENDAVRHENYDGVEF